MMAASRGGSDAAALVGGDNSFLSVQLNLPNHVGTSSNVRCCLVVKLA